MVGNSWRRLHQRGFTLVEILVVLAILTLLAAVLSVSWGSFQRKAKVNATKALLKQIYVALDSYKQDFGRFPPSTLQDFKISVANSVNLGIESLVACLLTQKKNGPYLEYDTKKLTNYDKDVVANFNQSVNKSGQAYEYTDVWKNPLIYIHARDYQNYQRVSQYQGRGGKVFSVQPAKDPKLNNYYNPLTFQLWSLGPNGRNENGRGDDIGVW